MRDEPVLDLWATKGATYRFEQGTKPRIHVLHAVGEILDAAMQYVQRTWHL